MTTQATTVNQQTTSNFFGATMLYFGLALTSCLGGVAAGAFLLPPALTHNTGFLLLMSIASIALVWTARSWSTHRLGYLGLIVLASVMGVTMIPLLAYAAATAGSSIILKALFGAIAMYAGLAVYGYTTRRDISGLGGFLMAGLIGMLAVSLITFVLHLFGVNVWGSQIEIIFSGFGILLFAGFTAYDFQKIKSAAGHMTPIQAAINLFLDFILLFEYILRFMVSLNRR